MKIKLRSLLLLPLDMIFIVLAYLLGMLIRHDGTIPRDLFELYFNKNFIIITLIYILVFTAFEMYNMLLEHVGFNDSVRMFCANVVAIILVTLYNYILQFLPRLPILPDGTRVRLPITVIIIAGLLILGFSIGIRIAPRGIKVIAAYFGRNIMDPCRVLIYGAGNAGAMLCKDLKRNPSLNYRVICYYDDEPKKVGNRLNGLRIYGGNLKYITEKFCINEIIIAVPSADSDDMVKIIAQCNETGCKLKTIPALYDLVIDEEVTFDKVRNVDTNDLLG
ncbi:MAG: hypothetical protein LBI03_10835, partial [Clostridiales bacterium]|nr:hypothetical protein [Clostridiales bacterium]